MKSFISILCTIISVLFVSSCVSSSKDDKTEINISCRECPGIEVSLTRFSDLPLTPIEIYKSQFDSLGRARIEFIQQDTLNMLLVVENKDQGAWKFYTTLYLEPGSDIDLTVENGLPKFEGDLKIINSYYYEIYLVEKERNQYVNANVMNRISASSSKKNKFIDSLAQFGPKLKSQIIKDYSIPNYYRRMLIDYFSNFEISQRMHFDTQVAQNEVSNKSMSVVFDSTLSDVFKDLNFRHNYIKYPNYRWYLNRRLGPIFQDILNYHYENGVKMGEYEYIKGAIIRDAKLNDYRELLMAIFIAQMSSSSQMDYNFGSKLINSFKEDYPQSKYLKELNYMLTDFYQLKSGMPMKDIEMHDIYGKAFSVSSLKGNLIYIDVWATWCGPCIDELEYSEKLSKKYSNYLDLKFLYVSIDEDTEKWKMFLRKNLQIKGSHGIQNSEFVADSNMITSMYKINGIPRYILIDKEGNLVTTNAKRPSELLSNNYLDSLLAL